MRALTLTCLMLLLVIGCAVYRLKPLAPEQTASSFEARTLQGPGLKAFIESKLGEEITVWPPESWDFTMLTLAALYYHPDLDVARSQWRVAEAAIITAGELPNPSVSFQPQYSTNSGAGISPWVLPFKLDETVLTAGKRKYRIEHARHLSEAARLKVATVAWGVRKRLRSSYVDLFAAERTVSILQNQLAIRQEEVRLLDQRLKFGDVSQPDVVLERIKLDQTRLSLQEARKNAAEARVELASALGVPEHALDGIEISFQTLEQLPAPDYLPFAELQRKALLSRTDILSNLADYAAAQSNLQLEIAKQYPDIVLGPGYEFDQGLNKWGIGVSLVLPILNQNQGPIAEAEAGRKESASRFIALQSQVLGEIAAAFAGYKEAARKLGIAESLLFARKDYELSVQTMFEQGESDRLTLVGAQLEVESSALSCLNALVEAQTALGKIEDATQHSVASPFSFGWSTIEPNPRSEHAR